MQAIKWEDYWGNFSDEEACNYAARLICYCLRHKTCDECFLNDLLDADKGFGCPIKRDREYSREVQEAHESEGE